MQAGDTDAAPSRFPLSGKSQMSTQERSFRPSFLGKLTWIGLGLGVLFWTVDSLVEALIFHKGDSAGNILTHEPQELWLRAVVLLLLTLLGAYAQYSITRQKRIEEALRESEERAQNVLENHIDGVALIIDGTLEYANPALAQILDRTQEELRSKAAIDLLAPKDRERMTDRMRDPREPLTGSPTVYHLLRKDGSTIPVEVTSREIQHAGKRAILTVVRDVTEHRRAEEALHESERLLRSVVTNAPIVLFAVDKDGKITLREGRALEAVGSKPREGVGQSVFDFHRDAQPVLDNVRRALTGETFTDTVEIRGVTFETHYAPVRDANDEVQGIIGVSLDITERTNAEQQMRALAKFPDEDPDPVLRIDADGTIIYANRSSAPILELWGREVSERLPDEWRVTITDALGSRVRKEIEAETGDRIFSLVLAPIEEAGYVNVYARDITSRKLVEETLRELSRRDPLTGLLNRRAGLASMGESLELAKRTGGRFGLLTLDVDNFKAINDTSSHEAGDRVLIKLAQVMIGLVRERGVVCRMGGDEFQIGLEGADADQALNLAEELQRSLRKIQKAPRQDQLPQFTVSIGVAGYPEDGATVISLGRYADQAMYAAKAEGGNRNHAWGRLGRAA